MAYLGANEAAFRLGNQAVSVYLGAVEVYSPVVTLYYNDAENDGSFATLGNWWMDAGHTVAATATPVAGDDVVLSENVFDDGDVARTVRNLTMSAGTLGIAITVTGVATFNGNTSRNDSPILLGNAIFNNQSRNDGTGTVNGNATFNDSAINAGTVNGTATFNGSANNNPGSITSNAIFNVNSANFGSAGGNVTFNGSSTNEQTVNGNATFNNSAVNAGTVNGTATFNGSAVNCFGTAGTFVPNPPPSC